MSVERGNAAEWGSPGYPQLVPLFQPLSTLGVVLGPPGSMATLLPQSPFSTQAATMAKSW